MSEDENSASNSEDGDDSKVSYQSMEDDYLQQQPEFEFSDSEDDSKQSSNESVQSNKSNTHRQLSAADKGLKNKPINIVPKAIHESAVAILNNDAIAKDLFKPCCSNKCLKKISPSHDCCNYEPCLQFMRERRVDLLGKSVSEQITLLKTYIYNSMHHRKPQVSSSKKSYHSSSGDNSSGRMNFEYVVEGHVFCGKGFCHLFGITYYLQKRLVKEIKDGRICVSYSDMDGKKLSTIDTEAAASIVTLLQDHKILISNSMKANLTLPDTDEIGYVSIYTLKFLSIPIVALVLLIQLFSKFRGGHGCRIILKLPATLIQPKLRRFILT